MRKKKLDQWLSGTRPNKSINTGLVREYILNKFERKCALCETGEIWNNKPLTFHIDHIDGDWRNNRPENLRPLCPNCHSQTETFGIKNKAKSKETGPRYKYVRHSNMFP